MAVGSYQSSTGRTLTLAERWNGSSWRLILPRNREGAANQLNAVSCTSATECTAVGSYAVAGVDRTLVERLSDHGWQIQPSPNFGDGENSALTGVSCTAATVCTAVGEYAGAIAERENGGPWTLQPTPPTSIVGGQFFSVSCPSASFCMAGGMHEIALSEVWTGASWRVHGTSNEGIGGFDGMYCSSSSACVGVGYNIYGPSTVAMAQSWDGTHWGGADAAYPTPFGNSNLAGVSCTVLSVPGTARCYAVGASNEYGYNPPLHTLVETFDGSAWTTQPSPNPAGATSSALNGVSCVSSPSGDVCMAVGDSDVTGALAELMG